MAINGNWTSSVVPKTENLYKLEVYIAQSDSMLPICTILSSRAHIGGTNWMEENILLKLIKGLVALKSKSDYILTEKGDLAFKLFE